MTTLRLTQLREEAGLSKAELARRAGVNERTIRNIENGTHKQPSLDTAIALAKALEVPFQALLTP
jgi:DNA-binding XRE family transcriptional regulator